MAVVAMGTEQEQHAARRDVALGTHPVAEDGRFSARVKLPVTAPSSYAEIGIRGVAIQELLEDMCDSDNSQCIGPTPTFQIAAK